ncbi:lipoprotein-releasing ABC transporter permease subunit [Candidatus Pelagadaptatus aseana]|uniref:lipoprotein-releasing ABC transporter permease subunit n=1 Tax=Candidatus Pelagadaptatus aseana TaxID=3120508 RepID=UPI003C706190
MLPIIIGLRYIRSKRRNRFISFVSSFSFLGMLLGSLALVTVLSVMNGFDREIKERLLQVIPHGTVTFDSPDISWSDLQAELQHQPGVIHAAPFIGANAMVSYERGLYGVQMRGLATADLKQLTNIEDRMIAGQLDRLKQQPYGVIIGRLLARYLGINIGDKLTVTLPQLTITPLGAFPRVKRFTVVGVFEVGAKIDQNLIITNLADAQKLMRLSQRVSGLELLTEDIYQAPAVIQRIAASYPADAGIVFQDWSQSQGSLFSAVKMEKTVVSVLLLVVIAIAAFNIISSLVLMVADKRSDIAVLRTLGLTRAQVMGVFVVQGGALGIFGVLFGTALGSLIASHIDSIVQAIETLFGFQIFDPNVYFISRLPSELKIDDLILVVSCGCLLSLLATLYPAYQAAKIEPAEALRYE